MARKKKQKAKAHKDDDHKRKQLLRIVFFAVVGLLLVLLISYVIGFKVHFLLAEELVIVIDAPTYVSMVNNQEQNIDITTTIDTHFSCQTSCVFELVNLADGSLLYSDSVDDVNDRYAFTTGVTIASETNGTALLSYMVTCSNRKTALCSATNTTYTKTTLITVDHAQSNEQEQITTTLQSELLSRKQEIITAKQSHADYFSALSQLLRNNQTQELQNNSNTIIDELIRLGDDLDLATELLINGDLTQTQDIVRSNKFSTVSTDLSAYRNDIISLVSAHNNLRDVLAATAVDVPGYSIAAYSAAGSSATIGAYSDLLSLEYNYQTTLDEVAKLVLELNTTLREYAVQEANTSATLQNSLDNINTLYNESLVVSCAEINTTISRLNALHAQHMTNRAALGNVSVEGFLAEVDRIQQDFTTLAPNTTLNLLTTNYTFNTTTFTIDTPLSILRTYFTFNVYDYVAYETGYCVPARNDTLVVPEGISIASAIVSAINETYELKEQCCLDSVCKACTQRDTTKRPVLLVHGHSFNSAVSPETTFVSFGEMQETLAEDGYINAGDLDRGLSYDNELESVWGAFSEPIVMRGTYYYLNYYDLGGQSAISRKHESIETYAIRLKEMIDFVQQRTGAAQVDIVAHSMGGLVSRQYISLFGEDDVHTLIMVGTPNLGVRGSIDTFCAVTGAKKECEEMQEGSVFLKRLNDARFAPQQTNFVTITARGCEFSGGDGDGVVLASNVPLPYATNHYIEGECSGFLGTDYHRDLIKPSIHPEVYDIITDYLAVE